MVYKNGVFAYSGRDKPYIDPSLAFEKRAIRKYFYRIKLGMFLYCSVDFYQYIVDITAIFVVLNWRSTL